MTSGVPGKMSEEKVCYSWTVQYTLKKITASTLRCTENRQTQISTCCQSLTSHWSTSAGSSEHLTIFNKNHIPVHLKASNTVREKLVHPSYGFGAHRSMHLSTCWIVLLEMTNNLTVAVMWLIINGY